MFEVNDGLKQGHVLSPLLFNIAFEYVTRKNEIRPPVTVFQNNGPNLLLAFVDDVDIIVNSRLNVKNTFSIFENHKG